MNRSKKLCILLGILAAACIATLAVLGAEERREQIKNSGETILALESQAVRSLSWDHEGASLAFHRDGTWLYDGDEAFPVSEEKIDELLEHREKYGGYRIFIDGACSPQVIARLSAKGVEGFVLGTSALFGKGKPYNELISELRRL